MITRKTRRERVDDDSHALPVCCPPASTIDSVDAAARAIARARLRLRGAARVFAGNPARYDLRLTSSRTFRLCSTWRALRSSASYSLVPSLLERVHLATLASAYTLQLQITNRSQ